MPPFRTARGEGRKGAAFIDSYTDTAWSLTGVAMDGEHKGKKLTPVPIEEGKTIDFSSGLPLVNDSAKQKAIIDRSVKAMEDAARDVTFGSPATSADTKKAEPSPTPPPPK